MRQVIVAGNWKMHLEAESARELATAVRAGLGAAVTQPGFSAVLCPPFPFLEGVRSCIEGSGIGLGAQNMHEALSGAFTGEVSPRMLASVGCTHVILGHSERRQFFSETDGLVHAKARAALAEGLTPIVCVGETLEEREAGRTEAVVHRQVHGALSAFGTADLSRLVLAYEPVWAIGTGRTASPAQAQDVHASIRRLLASNHGDEAASIIPILYGGSVKPENANDLFAEDDVDGGLIGGASLKASDYLAICAAGVVAAERRRVR